MATSKADKAEKEARRSGPLGKFRVYLKALGPGLITGTSDDDPSGIGTWLGLDIYCYSIYRINWAYAGILYKKKVGEKQKAALA